MGLIGTFRPNHTTEPFNNPAVRRAVMTALKQMDMMTAVIGNGIPGRLTESVAWGDYDNDGDQDLYLTSDGANSLFRNDGNDVFTDVTAATGTGKALFSLGLTQAGHPKHPLYIGYHQEPMPWPR